MDWEPRLPMTAAEQHVDFPGHHNHILTRRLAVEKAAKPSARRLAYGIVNFHGLVPQRNLDQLTAALERSLAASARYGYREARRELASLRAAHPPRVTAAYQVPDSGYYSQQARDGIPGILALIRRRARETAGRVAAAAALAASNQQDDGTRLAAATIAATKALHNNVLELVGETLNMGRTAGALSLSNPPTYALRSEQLDNNTCDACAIEHGEIYQTDSDAYYSHMPPSYCYGAGRCRGVYVFGDGVGQVRLDEAA